MMIRRIDTLELLRHVSASRPFFVEHFVHCQARSSHRILETGASHFPHLMEVGRKLSFCRNLICFLFEPSFLVRSLMLVFSFIKNDTFFRLLCGGISERSEYCQMKCYIKDYSLIKLFINLN